MAKQLSRRAMLTGIGGTAIALPILEAMMSGVSRVRAAAPTFPKRYLVCFDGQSLGADNDPVHNYYVPNTVGAGYDLKAALAPLADHGGIKDEITVVSGLKIPTANGGPVPAGGRADDFHINSLSPLLSGVRSGARTVNGPTSDQLVAEKLAEQTTFKSLVYRVQASWYLNVSAPYGRDIISYKGTAANPVAIPATVSPRAAFDSLFTGFTPPDPAEAARRAFLLRQRKSILDLVRGSTERLTDKLGKSDRDRLTRHLDEVRDLERRVAAIPPAAGGACQMLADLGNDPPVGGDQDPNGAFDVNAGYSNEDGRAKALCDLMYMAMVCDLTRVGSLQFTMAQSHMNTYPLINIPLDLHELGHSGGQDATMKMSLGIAWHMKHFGYLVSKFRDTVEDTGRMIDNMAIVMLHEGGHGYDPSAGKQYSSHCTDNMACLIAGRAGGLKPGRHVVATDKHPANVLVSAMNAVGVPVASLGEVTGGIPALFG